LSSSAARYAGIITDHATMRLLVGAGSRITELGYGLPESVGDAVDEALALLGQVKAGVPQVDVDVADLDEVCSRPELEADVVVPGLLHRQDRALIVAEEGMGKTMLLRMLGVMAAQGIHPFTCQPIPPVRSLLVDLENPEATIRRTCRPMLSQARRSSRDYVAGRASLFHRPEGLDIRTRAGFATLDVAFSHARPDLVCLGPLYKLYRSERGEQADDVAMDVTGRLDDLRVRYGFALVMEHHAPHGQGGSAREMRPFGSSVWRRWPEFGPALIPFKRNDRSVLAWSEWRPPREVRDWPVRLERGREWPWVAIYSAEERAA
jgi:replicative DNA helicase